MTEMGEQARSRRREKGAKVEEQEAVKPRCSAPPIERLTYPRGDPFALQQQFIERRVSNATTTASHHGAPPPALRARVMRGGFHVLSAPMHPAKDATLVGVTHSVKQLGRGEERAPQLFQLHLRG